MRAFLTLFFGLPALILGGYGVLMAGSWLGTHGYEWVVWLAILAFVAAFFAGLWERAKYDPY